jgi:hypothetical protein
MRGYVHGPRGSCLPNIFKDYSLLVIYYCQTEAYYGFAEANYCYLDAEDGYLDTDYG